VTCTLPVDIRIPEVTIYNADVHPVVVSSAGALVELAPSCRVTVTLGKYWHWWPTDYGVAYDGIRRYWLWMEWWVWEP
jgi:hypothetical protein